MLKNALVSVCLLLCPAGVHAKRLRLTEAHLRDSVLSLERCFELAYEHNADLRAAASAVVATYGEKIVNRARFLPRVDLLYKWGKSKYTDSVGQVRQRIAEFGPTSDEEYAREDRERRTRHAREDAVAAILSEIRRVYRSLAIIEAQLEGHHSLLQHYEQR